MKKPSLDISSGGAEFDIARQIPARSEPSGAARLWEGIKLALFFSTYLIYMIYRSKIAFRFWWYRLRGRDGEVDAFAWRTAEPWSRRLLTRLGCEVEVIGAENLPPPGPLVVMSNHQSYFDIPVLMSYLGRPLGFIIKRELLFVPGLAYWMRRIHCRSLDRANNRDTLHLFERWGRELVDHDRCLVLFPEGTRTRDPGGAIGPFRRGSLRLAESLRIPILPVSIDGTRMLTKPGPLARTRHGGRRVRIKLAPAVYPEPMNAPEAKRFMEEIRATITSNWEEIRVDWPASLERPHKVRPDDELEKAP